MPMPGDSSPKQTPAWDGATVDRLLASRTFAKTEQLRSILSYLCSAAAENRVPTEAEIGRNILNRPDFDPNTDTLVRVHMRRLRQKLDEYYQAEGAADAVRIEIPKQSYAPVLVAGAAPATDALAAPARSTVFRDWRVWAAVAVAGIGCGLAGWLAAAGRTSPATALPTAVRTMAQSAFWAPFFEPKSPPLLAVSTPLFFKTKDNYIRDFNLNFLDEMPNRPKSLSPPVAWPIWTTWISYSDAEAAMLLTNFFNSAGTSVSLTTGRQIQESDLESHAVVFLGHPRGMPLLNDFLKTRNFYAYQPGPGRSFGGIRNRAPRPGEKEVYLDWGSTSDEIQSVSEMAPDYGLITYSKPAKGPVRLSVFGHRQQVTSSLVRWLLAPNLAEHLSALGIQAPYTEFQVLFRINVMNGVPSDVQPITSRNAR